MKTAPSRDFEFDSAVLPPPLHVKTDSAGRLLAASKARSEVVRFELSTMKRSEHPY